MTVSRYVVRQGPLARRRFGYRGHLVHNQHRGKAAGPSAGRSRSPTRELRLTSEPLTWFRFVIVESDLLAARLASDFPSLEPSRFRTSLCSFHDVAEAALQSLVHDHLHRIVRTYEAAPRLLFQSTVAKVVEEVGHGGGPIRLERPTFACRWGKRTLCRAEGVFVWNSIESN
jgi:hypothetical protein